MSYQTSLNAPCEALGKLTTGSGRDTGAPFSTPILLNDVRESLSDHRQKQSICQKQGSGLELWHDGYADALEWIELRLERILSAPLSQGHAAVAGKSNPMPPEAALQIATHDTLTKGPTQPAGKVTGSKAESLSLQTGSLRGSVLPNGSPDRPSMLVPTAEAGSEH